ncbi:guanylate-binding protein 4-like [Mercenaria mercenaria]|uniref:guanylate-binding protein 4-like n=1 Tax=Mercenaria mercenaria TaxID=6596 RepID=UPI00234EE1B7|nr:guanylate-binding protein 4-like [Mercenaria mercenaria]
MMSTFNQDAVEKLTFISEMSKNISFANGEIKSDKKFDLILPTFVLCLRDFILDIQKDGEEITPDEYLEDCLELKPGKGKDIEKFNRPRECIMRYFQKRKCFTFDRPGNRRVMKRLETARKEELSEDFLQETQLFLDYVYNCKPKVLLNSKPVRGEMFATLATSYIDAVRNGAIPDVDNAIQMVAKIENKRMANVAVEEFKAKLRLIELPILQVRDFNQLYEAIQNASLANFRREAVFDAEEFEKRAIDDMDKAWKLIKEQNSALIRDYCLTQLKKIHDGVTSARGGKEIYLIPGGYELYKEDIGKIKRQYKLTMRGVEDFEVSQTLNEFMEQETENDTEILMKDKRLTAADRQREIERMQRDNQEALEEQQRLHEKMLGEEKKRSEKHFKKLEMERKAYMEREEEKLQMLMQQWEAQRESNERQIQMMITENKKQRNEFKKEIRRMTEENRIREEKCMERINQIEKENNQKQNEALENERQKTDKLQSMINQQQNQIQNLEESDLQRQREAKGNKDEILREQQKNKILRKQHTGLQNQCSQMQADISQRSIDVENCRRKIESIEVEKQEKEKEVERLKNRNLWDRLWNK